MTVGSMSETGSVCVGMRQSTTLAVTCAGRCAGTYRYRVKPRKKVNIIAANRSAARESGPNQMCQFTIVVRHMTNGTTTARYT